MSSCSVLLLSLEAVPPFSHALPANSRDLCSSIRWWTCALFKNWTSFLSGSWVISSLVMAFNVLYSSTPATLRKTLWERAYSVPLTETAPSSPTHIRQQGTEAVHPHWPCAWWLNPTWNQSLYCVTPFFPVLKVDQKWQQLGLPNAVFPVFWHPTHHQLLSYRKMLKNSWLQD